MEKNISSNGLNSVVKNLAYVAMAVLTFFVIRFDIIYLMDKTLLLAASGIFLTCWLTNRVIKESQQSHSVLYKWFEALGVLNVFLFTAGSIFPDNWVTTLFVAAVVMIIYDNIETYWIRAFSFSIVAIASYKATLVAPLSTIQHTMGWITGIALILAVIFFILLIRDEEK